MPQLRVLYIVLVTGACLTLATQATAQQPTLDWETVFSVTPELEGGDNIVADADGNVIVVQYLGVERDFSVMKLDPNGTVLWERTIGGSDLDEARGVTVDASGDIYLAGRTLSDDFPVQSAYQSSLNGPSDAIIMKLAGDDGSTIFSTYFGGSRGEAGNAIALGPDGSVYLAGHTDSIDLKTENPIQSALTLTQCFCDDAFITQFTPQVDQVVFGTYLGGGFRDQVHGLQVDGAGNIYFAGFTRSDDWVTANAAQPMMAGGLTDLVAGKISSDYMLSFSTYLGGEGSDRYQGMTVDGNGHMYLAGTTSSVTFPTTAGAFQPTYVGGIDACEVPFAGNRNCYDMFVTKLALDGGSLDYSTFIGGTHDDEPRDIAVDAAGRAHVIGYTYSEDFPLDIPFGNVVVAALTADGSDLEYVVTHDTPGANSGSGVAISGDKLYITSSVGLPYDTYIAQYSISIPDACPNDATGEMCDTDLDGDCVVNNQDLGALLAAYLSTTGDANFNAAIDFNNDGVINNSDLGSLLADYLNNCN